MKTKVRIDVKRFVAAMRAKEIAAEQALWNEILLGVERISSSALKRSGAGKGYVSVQDAPRRAKIVAGRAVTKKLLKSNMAALVIQRGFWTSPKSTAMQALLARHGLAPALERTHLYVNTRRPRGKRESYKNQKHEARSGLRRVSLSKAWLGRWVDREDRGAGVLRRTAYINLRLKRFKPVLKDLTLGAAVNQWGPTVRARIAAAAKNAVRKAA